MLNFFDLMGAAQGGTGLDALARQFGLSQDQAQRAFAALMPAFALGLQRNAATPNAFSNLMQMMGSGMPAEAQAQGKEALGLLFGPPELTRQVAEQASHWSGVSAQVLQQMMPIFAAALVASLSKFSEVMRAQAAAGRPASSPAPAATPYAAWAEMMRGFMGGAARPAPPPSPASPSAASGEKAAEDANTDVNPWADMLRTMGSPPADHAGKPAPEPEARPAAEPAPSTNDLQAAWSQAMESGREAQAQYLATLQNIFDQFWGAGPDRR